MLNKKNMVRRRGNGVISRIDKEYAEIRKRIANENRVSYMEADSIVASVIKEMNGTKKTRRFDIRF